MPGGPYLGCGAGVRLRVSVILITVAYAAHGAASYRPCKFSNHMRMHMARETQFRKGMQILVVAHALRRVKPPAHAECLTECLQYTLLPLERTSPIP